MTRIAYKAFNKDWTCNGFQYEVGESYEHKGDISICSMGFHSCENPLDVLNYYDLCESKFALVEVSGKTETHNDDSKICSSKIKIKGAKGCVMVLIHYDKKGNPAKAVTAIAGKTKGINPDTWYRLDENGKFEEAA